jgi:phytoene dehydrogenase-like protein
LKELLAETGGTNKPRILEWLDRFIALNTFEISIPALKDPDMAPVGKTGVIVSLLAEYDLFHAVAEAGWYKEFVNGMEDRIQQLLGSSVYPMLKDKVLGRFSFTPLSYASRVGSSEGAITGWSFQEPIPVPHTLLAAAKAVKTPIPNIFQAGQWTYSPAGVPMSILTGKLAAQKIL